MSFNNNNPRALQRSDFLGILGVSRPGGDAQINSIKPHIVSCENLYVTSGIYFTGTIKTPLNLINPIRLADGSAGAPAFSFANSTDSGMYFDGTDVCFSYAGTPKLCVGTNITALADITTGVGQDLVLNPSGPNVDFSGKNLINVGGTFTNPNRYEVIAPATVQTTNATPTTLYVIATVPNATYTLVTEIACTDNTDMTSTAAFSFTAKAKNLGGTVTVTPFSSIGSVVDVGLAGVTVQYVASGADIVIQVIGVAATTIKWFGATSVTRQLF